MSIHSAFPSWMDHSTAPVTQPRTHTAAATAATHHPSTAAHRTSTTAAMNAKFTDRLAVSLVDSECARNQVIFRPKRGKLSDGTIEGVLEFPPTNSESRLSCPVYIKQCVNTPNECLCMISPETIHYWSRFKCPVILIGVYDEQLIWTDANHAIKNAGESGFNLTGDADFIFPLTRQFDGSGLNRIKRLILQFHKSLPRPTYDPSDHVLRCPTCTAEVVKGVCTRCGYTSHMLYPFKYENDNYSCPFCLRSVRLNQQCTRCHQTTMIDWSASISCKVSIKEAGGYDLNDSKLQDEDEEEDRRAEAEDVMDEEDLNFIAPENDGTYIACIKNQIHKTLIKDTMMNTTTFIH